MRICAKPVTPKQLDVFKSDIRFIRTPDVIKKKINFSENLEEYPWFDTMV